MEQSKKFRLNKADLISLGKGLLITLAGAALTWAAQTVTQIDFGTWTPFVVAAAAFVINAIRKFIVGI
jgi:hypothetical protein